MKKYVDGKYEELTQEEQEAYDYDRLHQNFNIPTQEQAITFLRSMAASFTALTDSQALSMPDILPTWAELLERGEAIAESVCLMKEGQCYRQMQPGGVIPLQSQPPGGEGVSAVYRPVVPGHAGTLDDPIPWVYEMDCEEGKYYSNKGKIYLCTGDMSPCVWAPGTAGVWQWEVVT